MKALIRKGLAIGSFFTLLLTIASSGQTVTQAGVPGDNFSLEGALELFKKSASIEEFERLLNVPDSKVNNLDLNGDGYTDYIRVIDRYEGRVHAFILQALISDTQSQDIAVIELEEFANGKASLQIVGDPDIYGVETIIEPTQEVRMYAGNMTSRAPVNVWSWPIVQYSYNPYYSVWISPYSWSYRPVWWYPWRPVSYVVYRPYWDPYVGYYSSCRFHRSIYASRVYVPVRTTSVIVYHRHRDVIMQSRNTRGRDYDRHGYYRNSDQAKYSRAAGRSSHRLEGRSRSSSGETRVRDSNNSGTRTSYQESVVNEQRRERSSQRQNSGRDYTQPAPQPRSHERTTYSPSRSSQDSHSNRNSTSPSRSSSSGETHRQSFTPVRQSNESHRQSSGGSVTQRSSHTPTQASPSHSGGHSPSTTGKRGRD